MAAPPSFLQSLPSETDATDGDIVTFQVKVSEDPSDPTVVSWWKSGEPLRPLPGRRDIVCHGGGWHELVLSNVVEEDEGEYECRAETGRGHASSFGSLYYYCCREEGAGALRDVAMDREGDGRQSGLLILIDDGSQTEESGSEKSDRKSMTVSEQMQGIIEDLTQGSSTQGSVTLEEKEDEDQFASDIDDDEELIMQNILGLSAPKTVSEDTLVPEMPSPDSVVDVAMSEGASDPYGPSAAAPPHKWSSNPNHVHKKKKKDESKEEAIWPPEASLVTFDLPADTLTASVELPFTRGGTSTEEGAAKCTGGAETPFDVADITEEALDAASFRCSPTDVATTATLSLLSCAPPARADQEDSSITSVTDISTAAVPPEGCQQPHSSRNKMSFVKSSVKSSHMQTQEDGVTSTTSSLTSNVSMESSSMTVHRKLTRTADDCDREESASMSFASKKTRVSSAYEADESSLVSAKESSFVVTEHKVSFFCRISNNTEWLRQVFCTVW